MVVVVADAVVGAVTTYVKTAEVLPGALALPTNAAVKPWPPAPGRNLIYATPTASWRVPMSVGVAPLSKKFTVPAFTGAPVESITLAARVTMVEEAAGDAGAENSVVVVL